MPKSIIIFVMLFYLYNAYTKITYSCILNEIILFMLECSINQTVV